MKERRQNWNGNKGCLRQAKGLTQQGEIIKGSSCSSQVDNMGNRHSGVKTGTNREFYFSISNIYGRNKD